MAGPATVAAFLDLVRRSALIDASTLDAFLSQATSRALPPNKPSWLARAMLDAGIMTRFQAEQFLQGKWRGFYLGKYKVLERLGSGGMSNVYLCEHRLMCRQVAVKVPLSGKIDLLDIRARFFREVRAAALVDHPNIVCAHDVQQDEQLMFLVMEYVDGPTLRHIVAHHGPMDIVRAAHYIRQAALALHHVHQAGIVHRDVKPGNLLLSRTGVVKLFDFGLSRFLGDETNVLTQQDIALGTADYIAPEQARDSHGVEIAADIYSLGGTFYHILTGRAPFEEGTLAEKLLWQQTRLPPALRSLRPEVPAELAAVVERMMAKEPSERYPSGAAVMEAVAPWTETPIPPPPEAEMPQLSPAVRSAPRHPPADIDPVSRL
jgi:eukaryotic-like serine/threonine-protein kinase